MGLGSLTLLRALQCNRNEGSPGELMSFDTDPRAGGLVRDQMRGDWHRILGSTSDTLAPALKGRCVGMFVHDTAHTEENQRLEFGVALSHAASHLLLVDGSGGLAPTLEDLCSERGGSYHRVQLRSRDHIHPGGEVRFGVFVDAGDQLTRAG
jgi:hypothetical protein